MTDPALRVSHLSFTYPDGTRALDDVSLTVNPGERVAVIGPNGAGKSTLLFQFNGVLSGEGRVEVDGLLLEKKSLRVIRHNVGLVMQDPHDQLFMPTVFEDVAFGPMNSGCDEAEIQDRVGRALKQVGMAGSEALLPHHLSLGQRKKITLATVLAMDPVLLALDEPSSGLDPRSRRNLIQLLRSLPQAQIIATHDLDLVLEVCQRAVLLDQGRVVAEEKIPAVFERDDLLLKHGLEKPLSRQGH